MTFVMFRGRRARASGSGEGEVRELCPFLEGCKKEALQATSQRTW